MSGDTTLAGLREDPKFRRGYDLGYQARAAEEQLAALEAHGPRSRHEAAAPAPRSYGTDDTDLAGRLAAGDVATRELHELTDAAYVTEVPCCGRRISLLAPEDDEEVAGAACCHCGMTYGVRLVTEEPDGYSDDVAHVAVFTVAQAYVAVAQHRAGRVERAQRARRSRR